MTLNKLLMLGLCISLVSLVGCKGEEEDEEEEEPIPMVDCSTDAGIPTYADVTAMKACKVCHSAGLSGDKRHDAPDDVNFDTYAAAKASAEQATRELNADAMPPADSKLTVSDEEKEVFYRWALCGTPK